jgi:hypothetical protein
MAFYIHKNYRAFYRLSAKIAGVAFLDSQPAELDSGNQPSHLGNPNNPIQPAEHISWKDHIQMRSSYMPFSAP